MIAYKVVKSIEGELVSFNGQHRLRYSTDKATVAPENTKLFVFGNRLYAEIFCEYYRDLQTYIEIWECEVDILEEPRKFISDSVFRIREYWFLVARRFSGVQVKNSMPVRRVPMGTMWCNSVKLLRRVK